VKDGAIGMIECQGIRSRRAVLNVTDDDVVAAIHEFTGVSEANTTSTTGDDNTPLDGSRFFFFR